MCLDDDSAASFLLLLLLFLLLVSTEVVGALVGVPYEGVSPPVKVLKLLLLLLVQEDGEEKEVGALVGFVRPARSNTEWLCGRRTDKKGHVV